MTYLTDICDFSRKCHRLLPVSLGTPASRNWTLCCKQTSPVCGVVQTQMCLLPRPTVKSELHSASQTFIHERGHSDVGPFSLWPESPSPSHGTQRWTNLTLCRNCTFMGKVNDYCWFKVLKFLIDVVLGVMVSFLTQSCCSGDLGCWKLNSHLVNGRQWLMSTVSPEGEDLRCGYLGKWTQLKHILFEEIMQQWKHSWEWETVSGKNSFPMSCGFNRTVVET